MFKLSELLSFGALLLILFLLGTFLMKVGVLEIKFPSKDTFEWCAEGLEGYFVQCFDKHGGYWFSVYPVDYLNNTQFPDFRAFDDAQLCSSTTEKYTYKICVTEKRV